MLVQAPRPFDRIGTSRPERLEHHLAPEGIYALHRAKAIPLDTQLLLRDAGDLHGPLAAIVLLDDDMLGRIESLTRFWRAIRGRPVPPDTRLTIQQRYRFRLMMRAVDGRINRASYREIAEILFGHDRVASEPWKTSSLRDTVSELAENGFALIAGGYRRLLRHRRRS